MANPYVNKVQKSDGTVLIDISDSTVTADNLPAGLIAYDATGARIVGTNGALYSSSGDLLYSNTDQLLSPIMF